MNEAVVNQSPASLVEEAGKGILESQKSVGITRAESQKATAEEQYFFCDVVQVSEINITFWTMSGEPEN